MNDRTGILIVVAALILGASVVAGGLLIQSAVLEAAGKIDGLRLAVASAAGPPSAAAPTRAARQGLDPSLRYTVETDGSPARGPEDAKVAVVEFSDFQCPFCSRVEPTLKQVQKTYGDDVRIVFKHLPLSIHSKAPAAHAAAEAAHRQGKFWEMHDLIFANQAQMSPEKYVEYAQQLGLDVDQFKADVDSPEVRQRVEADMKEAQRLNITGTPGFFVNGRYLRGAVPFESFQVIIDEELGRG